MIIYGEIMFESIYADDLAEAGVLSEKDIKPFHTYVCRNGMRATVLSRGHRGPHSVIGVGHEKNFDRPIQWMKNGLLVPPAGGSFGKKKFIVHRSAWDLVSHAGESPYMPDGYNEDFYDLRYREIERKYAIDEASAVVREFCPKSRYRPKSGANFGCEWKYNVKEVYEENIPAISMAIEYLDIRGFISWLDEQHVVFEKVGKSASVANYYNGKEVKMDVEQAEQLISSILQRLQASEGLSVSSVELKSLGRLNVSARVAMGSKLVDTQFIDCIPGRRKWLLI